ncbi:hypothetical protein BDZ91DRAFT_293733 [Kalaharituber pfeilii]|nr:hypothetical protein BDZ91DRAFT_293733 [Kalaharituber pfeilii]
MAQTSSTAAGESYNSQSAARPTQQQIEELRKKAQAAVLNLLPLKLTFKDFVDEGINPYILRQVFERIGLPIPPEDNTCSSTTAEAKQSLPPTAPRDDITAKEAQEKEAKEKEKEAKEKEKEAKEKEKEAKEKEKEAKRLMLQEKLRQQEMILREQEQRKKEQERLKKEEERQQREAAAEAAKKKEEEMRLQAEAAARKKQEDLRELEEKKRIVQQKFEEMRLPPKPPAPLISNPIVTSLPSTTRSVMIPGLLLDTMDMGPRAPQTPMTAPTVTHPEVSSTITLHQKQDDTMIKDTTDRGVDTRTTIRRKRPVAADFDTELNATPYHFKRRFGSLRVGDFVIELTDDEDGEDTEVDEAQSLASSAFYTAQTEANTIQRTSRSPSDTYTGAQQNDRNGKSPPARSTSTVNGADAAKQLQDTEEKIRKLREEILLRQEKKRKPSGTGASTATATPTRVSTPSSVPGLNNNTAPATSPVVSISSSIVPIPSLPPKPPTPLGSFDNPVAPIVRVSETSSIVSANVQNEESLKDVHPANTIVETTQEKGKNEVMIEQAQTQTLTHGHAELVPGRRAPDATLPRTEETETPKMREEAERLRMLLLSKRKAAEAKTIVAQQNAKPAETLPAAPAAAAVQSQVEPKEVTPTTKAMESTLVPEIPQGNATSSANEQVSTHSSFTHISADTRERSESPYEPTLDVVRKLSESPPYEPSLGPEDDLGAGVDTKMDIDEQDAEEGEILEESVAMDVDSEDEDYDNKVHVLDPVTAQKQVEDSTATVLQTPNENLSSTISAQAPNPVLLTSPDRVEHATNISVGNVTNVSKTATAPGLHSKDKVSYISQCYHYPNRLISFRIFPMCSLSMRAH